MDTIPAGITTALKAATRALVIEMTVARVKELTGASDGQVSRWQGQSHPDVIPLWAVAILETACGQPIVTRALAGLTAHVLTPAGAEDAPNAVAAMIGTARAGAAATEAMGAALADGTVTPGEAREVLSALHAGKAAFAAAERCMAGIAAATEGPTVVALRTDGAAR